MNAVNVPFLQSLTVGHELSGLGCTYNFIEKIEVVNDLRKIMISVSCSEEFFIHMSIQYLLLIICTVRSFRYFF